MKEELLKILINNINLKGIATDLIDNVIEEALKKVVADTATTFDDMAMAALYPVLEVEIKKLIEEHLDLATLLKVEEKVEAAE